MSWVARRVDPAVFAGKTLVDVANATTPSFELVYLNSSLAEHLQAALPEANIVKTLNCAAITLGANPAQIASSSVFLSGNSAEAKSQTAGPRLVRQRHRGPRRNGPRPRALPCLSCSRSWLASSRPRPSISASSGDPKQSARRQSRVPVLTIYSMECLSEEPGSTELSLSGGGCPVGPDGKGGFIRTLPDGVSSGSVISGLMPSGAHFVKAFGTIGAEHLADAANRSDRAVLFHATDDDAAAVTAERLISVAGFAPVRAGGLDQAIRIEMFGALHDYGGLNGKLLTTSEARALLADARG